MIVLSKLKPLWKDAHDDATDSNNNGYRCNGLLTFTDPDSNSNPDSDLIPVVGS